MWSARPGCVGGVSGGARPGSGSLTALLIPHAVIRPRCDIPSSGDYNTCKSNFSNSLPIPRTREETKPFLHLSQGLVRLLHLCVDGVQVALHLVKLLALIIQHLQRACARSLGLQLSKGQHHHSSCMVYVYFLFFDKF